MIIDRTYFWGNLSLPFRSTAVGTAALIKTEETAEVDAYIAKYEAELLKKIFGDLYDTYVAGRASEPWLSVDALIVDAATKTSVIANYVYFHYWNDKSVQVDVSGTFVKEREGGTVVANSARTIPAWNNMINNLIPLFAYLTENHDTLVTGESDFNYDGWADFVYYSRGYRGLYLNTMGL